MEFLYQGNSNNAGIYKLTNKFNGRIYIGSTKEFKARWKQHAKALESGKHTNAFLLNDFNKCGSDVFVFEVCEVVETGKDDRLSTEQLYLDKYYDNQVSCYNLRPEAVSREGGKNKLPNPNKGKHLSPATEFKKGMIPHNNGKTLEELYGEQKAQKLRQINSYTASNNPNCISTQFKKGRVISGIHNPRAKRYELSSTPLVSPTGEEFVSIKCLSEFCKTHCITSPSKLGEVICGKRTSHKGWYIR